jgi:hypothetical protein
MHWKSASATGQNLRAVCCLTFLLVHIDRSIEPSREKEASSTELQRVWTKKLSNTSTNGSHDYNMQLSQNPAAHESSGTLTTPSGYSTPRLSAMKEKSPASSTLSMGNGRRLPLPLEEEDYVVDFEGPDDPRNPQNWSTWKK